MTTFLRAHLDVLYVITGCGVAVLLGALFMPRWLRGVAYSRRSPAHALSDHYADPVWGDLSWHDEAFERALAEDDDPCATAPFAPDLSSDATIRKYQLEAWDSAGFPAIPRTVQTVTLPSEDDGLDHSLDPMYDRVLEIQRELENFPGPSDSPARDAGAERLAASHVTGGEPSTNLPGPVLSTSISGEHATELALGRAGEPFWRRILAFLRPAPDLPGPEPDDTRNQPRRPVPGGAASSGSAGEDNSRQGPGLPGASSARGAQPPGRDGEPVLEGRIITGPPPAVLGYIDGLALTGAYYERIEQIGVQARVLALAGAS